MDSLVDAVDDPAVRTVEIILLFSFSVYSVALLLRRCWVRLHERLERAVLQMARTETAKYLPVMLTRFEAPLEGIDAEPPPPVQIVVTFDENPRPLVPSRPNRQASVADAGLKPPPAERVRSMSAISQNTSFGPGSSCHAPPPSVTSIRTSLCEGSPNGGSLSLRSDVEEYMVLINLPLLQDIELSEIAAEVLRRLRGRFRCASVWMRPVIVQRIVRILGEPVIGAFDASGGRLLRRPERVRGIPMRSPQASFFWGQADAWFSRMSTSDWRRSCAVSRAALRNEKRERHMDLLTFALLVVFLVGILYSTLFAFLGFARIHGGSQIL